MNFVMVFVEIRYGARHTKSGTFGPSPFASEVASKTKSSCGASMQIHFVQALFFRLMPDL